MSASKEFDAMLEARGLMTIPVDELAAFQRDFKGLVDGMVNDRLEIVERLSTAREARSWKSVKQIEKDVIASIDDISKTAKELAL